MLGHISAHILKHASLQIVSVVLLQQLLCVITLGETFLGVREGMGGE
jgi:hypothetical protein